ncbi:Uncharacterized protein FWK35_00003916 [Aphis craccivora]|uniref:MULE transposase domain-containing protein n=1 Tax=Aphis craccivora TaxID=307492 RepID=A0A6G0YY79_APHCR|nr:Uncharacterized protein FWK35_00003916 [Aphis craccivora]
MGVGRVASKSRQNKNVAGIVIYRRNRRCGSQFWFLFGRSTIERENENKIIWKCVEYNTKKCCGRLHSSGQIEAKEGMARLKNIAKTTQLSTYSVLGTLTSQTTSNIAEQFPKRSAPPNPKSVTELKIPDNYTKTSTNRFLIFTTDNNLQLMEQCEHWLCDGTFSCVPSIFHQLYTIRGINDSKVVPAVYKLLRNKKEDTYKRMFLAIKFLKPQLNPKSMFFDFEKAAMNASKYSIWRHVQSKSNGLQVRYSNDSNFALELRKLVASAYVPVNNVITAFESLLDSEFYR